MGRNLFCFEKVSKYRFDFSVHVSVCMCMMGVCVEGGSNEEEGRSRITPMFLVLGSGGGYAHTPEARRQSVSLGHVRSEEYESSLDGPRAGGHRSLKFGKETQPEVTVKKVLRKRL